VSTPSRLDRKDLDRFLAVLAGSYDVHAPVTACDGSFEYAPVRTAEGLDGGRTVTGLSPKGIFFPKDEVLFQYDGDGIRSGEASGRPIAVWGMRGCDARSLALLDRVFGSAVQKPGEERFQDPYWKARYDGAVIFGAVCVKPLSTCFCNWFGGSPSSTEGMDVQVTDLGDAFLLAPVTPEGEELLRRMDMLTQAADTDLDASREVALRAGAMMSPPFPLEGLDRRLPELFHDPAWAGIAAPCVNCGACTFACPTCHCFDVQDEGRNGRGRRLRVWDSCMFSSFTLEASGHNPRARSLERVRQRVMHKFSYFPANYGESLCTGCGRCVAVCPVGFDIRKVLRGLGAPRDLKKD
jgi:sulfhydrogenase subunit beta (sulfur reductase)